jgi:hypothetical protein
LTVNALSTNARSLSSTSGGVESNPFLDAKIFPGAEVRDGGSVRPRQKPKNCRPIKYPRATTARGNKAGASRLIADGFAGSLETVLTAFPRFLVIPVQ